ncbi:MAG: rhomboid family intramembrane serine protease [Saprospiraceae bacterium]
MNLTLILVILTGLISYQAFENQTMKAKLLFRPASIREFGEYFRFLTHGFVHADWGHLGINMFVLYQFGQIMENFFVNYFGEGIGRMSFIILYLGGVVAASIPGYFKHKNNPYYSAVGASGGTSAVVFGFVILAPWQWFLFPPLPGILFAVAYLWYSSYMGKRGGDNIAHDAHFWGAVYGFVVTLLLIFAFNADLLSGIIANFLSGPTMPNF